MSAANWIAFIRGINVGGHRKVIMAELREALTAAGLFHVKTYIQSGNCVFASDKSSTDLQNLTQKILNERFACDVPVVVLSKPQLADIHQANPFEGDPSRVMFYFCTEPLLATFDPAELMALLTPDEQLQITPQAIYLHAPSGIGQSILADKLPRLVPVELTARNLRTVEKMIDLASEIAGQTH